jgi:serine/threonine protein phosphatase PrpC
MGGKPSNEQVLEVKPQPSIVYSSFSNRGRRPKNEDRMTIKVPLVGDDLFDQSVAFFAIYDGHNGSATAEKLAEVLHENLAKQKQFDGGVRRTEVVDRLAALEGALVETDKSINWKNVVRHLFQLFWSFEI